MQNPCASRRRQRAPLPQSLFSERIFNCLREKFFIATGKEKKFNAAADLSCNCRAAFISWNGRKNFCRNDAGKINHENKTIQIDSQKKIKRVRAAGETVHLADAFCTRQIILLYNIDTSWPEKDQNYIRQLVERMQSGIENFGFTVHPLVVQRDLSVLDRYDPQQWLVFNWCEGFEGMPWSDALVARNLEVRGFTFTGADSRTLTIAQDKWRVKRILLAAGVPTPAGMMMTDGAAAEEWTPFPALVKPVIQHGSFGVTKDSVVEFKAELQQQVDWVKKTFASASLVEPFLNDREFQVAVWGNHKLQALPPVELDYSEFTALRDRLYTFDSKFNPSSPGWFGIKWHCPAPVDEDLRGELARVAMAAFRAVRCRDYARFDIRLFNGKPMILDVNPNPDLDPTSVFPAAAETIGINYASLALRILQLAAIRLRRRLAMRKTKKVRTPRRAVVL